MNVIDFERGTPLLWAAILGDVDVLQELHEKIDAVRAQEIALRDEQESHSDGNRAHDPDHAMTPSGATRDPSRGRDQLPTESHPAASPPPIGSDPTDLDPCSAVRVDRPPFYEVSSGSGDLT